MKLRFSHLLLFVVCCVAVPVASMFRFASGGGSGSAMGGDVAVVEPLAARVATANDSGDKFERMVALIAQDIADERRHRCARPKPGEPLVPFLSVQYFEECARDAAAIRGKMINAWHDAGGQGAGVELQSLPEYATGLRQLYYKSQDLANNLKPWLPLGGKDLCAFEYPPVSFRIDMPDHEITLLIPNPYTVHYDVNLY